MNDREKQEAEGFVREEEELRENLRSIRKMNNEFPALLDRLKQALDNYHKMSPEEKRAANERIAKFRKLSNEQQKALIAKAEKLEREMDALNKRKPS